MGRPRRGEERAEVGTLNIKGIGPEARDSVRHAARIRGIPYATYLERLVRLHQQCRVLADGGDERWRPCSRSWGWRR
jgi:hypothetical protein